MCPAAPNSPHLSRLQDVVNARAQRHRRLQVAALAIEVGAVGMGNMG
jgi:hypothetical protein